MGMSLTLLFGMGLMGPPMDDDEPVDPYPPGSIESVLVVVLRRRAVDDGADREP